MAKKVKKEKEFFFQGMEKELFIENINTYFPIGISYLESLIDRIHKRYPLLDKVKITFIVKSTFESMREFLLLGKILNFNKFVFDMKLYFFAQLHEILHPSLKVKMTTAPCHRQKDRFKKQVEKNDSV